ncbi:glycosyltransferase [Alphaproteobacteria bacterium]|nr:glycosyltransferase [Alphaproteobacteria bacterium]
MQIETSPLISVVIPTYNHADFLKVAISSVIEQTYQNFEIVIVDNNSNDHTNEVVNSFNDDRIQLHKIDNKGVIAASRNLGVDHAKGDWIAYLDSDDNWYPSRLRCLVDAMHGDSKCDVISNDEYRINNLTGKKTKLIYGPVEGETYRSLLLFGNRLSTSATLVRRGFLLKNEVRFNESSKFVTVEDFDYWLQLALLDARFKFVHSFEGEYLVHGANSSGYLERHKKNEFNLLRYHVFEVQGFQRDKGKLWRSVQAAFLFREAYQKLKSGSILPFVKTLLNSIRLSPYFLGKWIFVRITFGLRNRFFFH